jgi:hypothetical protein
MRSDERNTEKKLEREVAPHQISEVQHVNSAIDLCTPQARVFWEPLHVHSVLDHSQDQIRRQWGDCGQL